MKPGITGLWQLYGNDEVTDFEEVVELDCKYIDTWSIWQDCKIILRTVLRVGRAGGY
jgi:lipopolysaccharide/colanic/teichoic acid biosynthesis glycosyltransferase